MKPLPNSRDAQSLSLTGSPRTSLISMHTGCPCSELSILRDLKQWRGYPVLPDVLQETVSHQGSYHTVYDLRVWLLTLKGRGRQPRQWRAKRACLALAADHLRAPKASAQIARGEDDTAHLSLKSIKFVSPTTCNWAMNFHHQLCATGQ